ncbi:MAG: HD domain-containing protein [Gemmatimonadales bacterium]|nr:MAG: HD domain-containing protein [Gemmatimonadales bacterium]
MGLTRGGTVHRRTGDPRGERVVTGSRSTPESRPGDPRGALLGDRPGSRTVTATGDAARAFLVALAQGLSARRLYGADHPRSRDSVTAATGRAKALLAESRRPVFSLLGAEVVYGDQPLRDPGPVGLAERLSTAGVQRIELRGAPTEGEMATFLGELELALRAAGRPEGADPSAPAPGDVVAPTAGEPANLVWGALRPRDSEHGGPAGSRDGDMAWPGPGAESSGREMPDLGVELEAISWIWDEIRAGRPLPLVEAEGVIRSLGVVLRDLPPGSAPRVADPGAWSYGPLHAMHSALLAMAWIREGGGTPAEIMDLGLAGLFHDVGLVRVAPSGSFEHAGSLDASERRSLETHPLEGARLLLASDARLALAAVVAFEHHLLPRGGGYPAAARMGPTHPASRLVQLLSAYDALRSKRPFRAARSPEAAREVLRSGSGRLFDASLVAEFERFDFELPASVAPDPEGVTNGGQAGRHASS